MRIGIEVQRLFRKKKHGMEVVALELLKELQGLDKSNQYTIFVKDGEDERCLAETENFKIAQLSGRSYFDWEQISLPKAVKKINPDFLHSTCNTSAIWPKAPLLLTLHDIIYLEKIDFKGTAYQNFGNIYRRYVVPKVVNNSKFVITVSHFERDVIIKKLNISPEKVKVVYNAASKKFNNNYSQEEINNFKSRFDLPNEFILFLGNTAPKKNTKNVIASYIEFSRSVTHKVPMVILDYDKTLVAEQLTKAGAADLLEHFIFPGFVPSDKMPLMYNAATLFLYPSLRESFGLPILEAMGCGTPVITSNTSSMPEVGGNAAVYVDPFNVADISKKIYDTISDKNLQTTLKENGIKRAEAFSWNRSARELLSIYQQM